MLYAICFVVIIYIIVDIYDSFLTDQVTSVP